MRRRQKQQQALMSEADSINPIDSEDPDITVDLEEDNDPLIAALEMSSPHGDDDRKASSLIPRNYNTRRRLMIAGGCFILAVILFQTRNYGKAIIGAAIISCFALALIVEGMVMAVHSSFLFPQFFGF
mmetsp:Transcript_39139/g.60273  ORF Transcript_39139/g.60273 Transcript_39139/m.60273 type:complete len:128 (+) Transcript_39139:234-617(+)|eukprot:CAMPEP_0117005274 /NCGR_PEP_ID=MMETSP0472-20121206/5953_1 /TAXON_ID=693140 ORGANISM="Tiarina fusus, Strain LIS" /NCGR_SAMPLE_ID=MMETSP0472 /ASSEMBLY_ACC=CAM_ASM_000603 /LENGTH=127 /DNA_ID=CAMNT_0004706477 /DNA_START=217 /DNA_END=600 /DNA_ORIENTATION=-